MPEIYTPELPKQSQKERRLDKRRAEVTPDEVEEQQKKSLDDEWREQE